jgi:uracil-DNA glycosylase family 4
MAPELGAGPLDAPLWLIGRDYGAEEHKARQPFVGQAGYVLNAALKSAGLDRAAVRIDNLVPVQPPGNDFARHTPSDVLWGSERLTALLREHRPRVVVGFGNEVCSFLVGEAWPSDGIQELRGYFWDGPFGRVLASVHPAAVLREWTPWRALLDFDMRRAKAEVDLGAPPLVQRLVRIVTHPLELGALQKAAKHAQLLAVDIENTHELVLACVGFAPSIDEAWVIPAVEGWQLDAIRTLCESATPKALQNGQYDRFFLQRFAGITLRNQVFDTQLAWHALNPELAGKKTAVSHKKAGGKRTAKSLKFLASIYLRVPYWKSYDFADEMERYMLCGRDCCNTLEIAQKQTTQFDIPHQPDLTHGYPST